jgi:alkylation response protein AidB-like acyl-CoA dehydrogenase
MSEQTIQAQEQGRDELERWRQDAATNRFDSDHWFRGLIQRLGASAGSSGAADELASRLHDLGEHLGPDLDDLVRIDNRDENLPVVHRHDRFGHPREEVVFHPAHHEIGRVFWGSGVLNVLGEPASQVTCGALAYLLDQLGEAGHACPVACSAGAILLLQRIGTPEQQQRYLPGLLEPDYDRRLHAAQLVTEVQGGSDVGANGCTARPDPARPGWYRISGEKWFCSVADAGMFVVSARPEGSPAEGTRGLALFLVPRTIDGAPNGFALRRLKYKLGTRSMPTGEIDFTDALGEPIGDLDKGFKHLISIVLDTSRVHNAVAASGICRRAFTEASTYATHRSAFGQPILSYPSVQEILARMRVRTMAAVATTFRILDISDTIDRTEPGPALDQLVGARRISVMINKYWTAIAATSTARDGIEIFGGNGTIEDFTVLPRLYRDAIVVESWEGTHNTLCAQVLRDFATRRLHEPWLALLDREITALADATRAAADAPGSPQVDQVDIVGRAGRLRDQAVAGIRSLSEGDEHLAAARVRTVVDTMCRLVDWVALATQLHWERTHGLDTAALTADALSLYAHLWLDGSTPVSHPEMVDLHQRLGRPD